MTCLLMTCVFLFLCFGISSGRHKDYDLTIDFSYEESSPKRPEVQPTFSAETINFIFNFINGSFIYPLENKSDSYDMYGDDDEYSTNIRKRRSAEMENMSTETDGRLELERKLPLPISTEHKSVSCDCTGANYTGQCLICLDTSCTNCTVFKELCVPDDRKAPISTTVCQPRHSFFIDCAENKCKTVLCKDDKCITEGLNRTSSEIVATNLGEQFDKAIEIDAFSSLLKGMHLPTTKTTSAYGL